MPRKTETHKMDGLVELFRLNVLAIFVHIIASGKWEHFQFAHIVRFIVTTGIKVLCEKKDENPPQLTGMSTLNGKQSSHSRCSHVNKYLWKPNVFERESSIAWLWVRVEDTKFLKLWQASSTMCSQVFSTNFSKTYFIAIYIHMNFSQRRNRFRKIETKTSNASMK